MGAEYKELIQEASRLVCERLMRTPASLQAEGRGLDGFVLRLLREVGREVMAALFAALGSALVAERRRPGLRPRRSPEVEFHTVFGPVRVDSPYLWSRDGQSSRPLREVFGVEGGGMSDTVDRALTDFGAEKSFDRAAKSFQEHYGWEIGRTTVRGHTQRAAADALSYLEEWRARAAGQYEQPLSKRPGVETMVVELDGCEVRTGQFMTAAEAGIPDDEPDRRVRPQEWREVRTGLVRPLDQVDPTYVCAMASYPDMCAQLHAAACHRGLARTTQVVAPLDGGQGLREAVEGQFPNAQVILDRPHLTSHLHETAEALGFSPEFRREWVDQLGDQTWEGHADTALHTLKQLHDRTGCERLRQLVAHLTRFRDAVHYGDYWQKGYPLGSGEIESAHRHIPLERLDIPGACWHPDSINPMVALRVVRANAQWNDFWAWRKARREEKSAA
jgi:hypothetical protein